MSSIRMRDLQSQLTQLQDENARLRQSLRRRSRRASMLAHIYNRVFSVSDLGEILQVTVEEISMALEAERCFISLEFESPNLPTFFEYHEESLEALHEAAKAMESLKGSRVYLASPIMMRHEVLGTLGLLRSARAWSSGEMEMVKNTVGGLAILLANARLLEENRQRAQEVVQLQAIAPT